MKGRCRICGANTPDGCPVNCKGGWWEHVGDPTPWWVAVALATVIVGGVVALAVVGSRADAPTTPSPTASPTATASTTPTPTHTIAPPTSTIVPATPTIEPAAPTKVPVSEIAEPPPVVSGGNLDALPVPAGTSVNTSGCASDGKCVWYNFYWAPTHEIVLQGEEPWVRQVHERCHAHQHWAINGGAPLAPSDYDLESWYGTAEATSYAAAATGWPFPYAFTTANNRLEDFAESCALYYTDPAYLQSLSPSRYEWMRGNLP